MQFNIIDLKIFLSLIKKHKVHQFHLKSEALYLDINNGKNQRQLTNRQYNTINKSTLQTNNIYQKHPIKKATPKLNPSYDNNTYFTIVAPMIGTFYRSPAPNESTFIEINDKVKINQTVCIIEAMKLMNEIKSEVNGHIVEILVKDGDIVDCGQALIKVKER